MESIDWETRLLPYKGAASELSVKFKCLAEEYNALGQNSPIQSVESRLKRVASIIEKMRRKGYPVEEFEERLEDIAGLRIICRFVEDIEEVVNLVRRRHGLDLEVLKERDYVSFMKVSGYRSYHMIIQYPVYMAEGKKEVKCEIQIRTMAMNFWAVIEHSLKYKYDKQIPEDIHKMLIMSADAAFMLDKKMSEIRLDIIAAESFNRNREHIIDSILDNIQVLYKAARFEEAEELNKKFMELHEKGDMQELMELKRQTRLMAGLYGLR